MKDERRETGDGRQGRINGPRDGTEGEKVQVNVVLFRVGKVYWAGAYAKETSLLYVTTIPSWNPDPISREGTE